MNRIRKSTSQNEIISRAASQNQQSRTLRKNSTPTTNFDYTKTFSILKDPNKGNTRQALKETILCIANNSRREWGPKRI